MKMHLTLLAALTIATSAAAQTETAAVVKDEVPENAFRFDIGLFSAVGEIGVSYNRDLVPHLGVEVGVGYGFSGLQLSVMPKAYFGSGWNRVFLGVGVSAALQTGQTDIWLNADIVGYEHRFHSGVILTAGFGLTAGLAGTYQKPNFCFSESCSPTTSSLAGFVSPQTHFGVGYAF